MSTIRHASACKPISVPIKNSLAQDNWDRVQSFTPATSQPLEKLYEIGRLASMISDKAVLETTLSISQLEYGTNDAFKQISGLSAEPSGGFDLDDFSSDGTNLKQLDFYYPGKDEYNGTLEQTLWLQHMVLDSFSVSMNANERIERSFEFSGEMAKILRYGNKYLIFATDDAPSGTSGNYVIDVSDPAPVVDPNNAGVYILDLWRIRSGVATQLELTTDYTYNNGTSEITILSATASDHYRIFYSSASYGTAGDPTSLNDVDDYYLKSSYVTVTIDDGTNSPVTLDRLTSLTIDATLNRLGEYVIGSAEKLLNEVESKDVSISLSGYVKSQPIQEALMTQAGQNWAIIDYSLFSQVIVRVYMYDSASKANFLIGYKSTACDFDSDSQNWNANEYADDSVSLSSDNLTITTTFGDM
jgi:hypothetical protein